MGYWVGHAPRDFFLAGDRAQETMSFMAFSCLFSSRSALMARTLGEIQNEKSDLTSGGSTMLDFKFML